MRKSIKMIEKPKNLCFLIVIVTFCISLCTADDVSNHQEEGRALSLKAAQHPAVAVGGGLVTLGLLGSTLALANRGVEAANRRSSYDNYDYYDRQDILIGAEGNRAYAENVRNFEDRTFRAAARTALRGMRNLRQGGRRFGKQLRKGARAFGHNTVQGIHAMARSTGRMAKSASHGMRTMARVAGTGLSKVGGVARKGVYVVGNGLRRIGDRTKRVGRRLAGAGVAAARGLSHVKDSYRRNVIAARSSIGNSLYDAGEGISRVGDAVSRGYRNYVNRLGTAYQRSIRRLGYVKPTLENAVQDSVSRIGEIASEGAATLGGIATDVTDQVSRVAEVPSDIARGLTNVAREKRVQDCFLQAMCYLSTPYLSHNEVKRRKRALESYQIGGWENYDNNENFEEEYRDFDEESRRNGNNFYDNNVHLDDCEVFECGVATLGRKVIGAVRKFGDR